MPDTNTSGSWVTINSSGTVEAAATGTSSVVGFAVNADPEPEHVTCESCEDTIDSSLSLLSIYQFNHWGRRQTINVCESCYDNGWTCADCELRFTEGTESNTYDNSNLCSSCYDGNYFRCDGCDNVFHNDNYCCDSQCSDCCPHADDDEPEPPPPPRGWTREWSGYHYSEDKGTMPTALLSGVEIECEKGDRQKLSDLLRLRAPHVGLTRDGSLDHDTGVELVTPPAAGIHLERLVKEACAAATESDFDVTDACGLHVHVAFDPDIHAAQLLFETVYAVEDILLAMQPNSRLRNRYCKALREHYTFRSKRVSPKNFRQKWYADEEGDTGKYNATRYHGLNLHSVFYRGTAEFRYHAGSLNADKILNWVRICQSLVSYATNRFNMAEVQNMLRRRGTPAQRATSAAEMLQWSPELLAYVIDRIKHFGETRVLWDPKAKPSMEVALARLLGANKRRWRSNFRYDLLYVQSALADGAFAHDLSIILEN